MAMGIPMGMSMGIPFGNFHFHSHGISHCHVNGNSRGNIHSHGEWSSHGNLIRIGVAFWILIGMGIMTWELELVLNASSNHIF